MDALLSTSTTTTWTEQRERGNVLAMRVLVWIALTLGRDMARLLLYPIALYFLVSASKPRRASRGYLERVLKRPVTWVHCLRHYFFFASTVLDRLYFLNDRFSQFDIKVIGLEEVEAELSSGQGCFLLGAHFGSFDAVRTVGQSRIGVEGTLVMYEENARQIGSTLRSINPHLALKIIALGSIDSMLRVRDSLATGECVGMMADRILGVDDGIAVEFLGGQARLPTGPFRLVRILRRPVVLMAGLYLGGNRYEIRFERLSAADGARESLQIMAQRYASRMEEFCRMAPYNWFNFYDYWR